MSNRQSLWIGLAAAALSAAAVFALHQAQLTQIDMQQRVSVVAPDRFVDVGEVLAAEDLHYVSVAASDVSDEMLRDIRLAAGQVAAVALGKDEPLLGWKLDRLGLQPKPGQSTFQVPEPYLLSVPGGIRAGDKVRLYLSTDQGVSMPLFREAVIVASVKTSGNREVDGSEHSAIQARLRGNEEALLMARRDANGAIERIELNLTEAQWLEIDNRCKDGRSKLVIAYVPGGEEAQR